MNKLMLLFVVVFVAFQLNASTITSTAVTGNWSAAGSWVGGVPPAPGDDAVIVSGAVITVDGAYTCATLTLNAPAANNGVTIVSPNSLTVSGAITMNLPTANFHSTINVGSGSLTAASIAIPGSSVAASRFCLLTVSTGSINVSGDITFSGTAAQAQLSFTGAGNLNIGGTLSNGGTFTRFAGCTVNFNGGPQTIPGYAFSNVILSVSGTKTLSATTTITGDLTLSGTASTTTVAALTTIVNLSIGDGTTFTAAAFALTITGTTTVGGGASGSLAITSATGTKTFNGIVTINSGADITESAAATLSFGSDVTITGTLTEFGAAIVGFAGDLTNNGTYNASTGVHTLSTTATILGGSNEIAIPSVSISNTRTNNGTFTVSTTLAGAGTLVNGATGTLNFGGASIAPTLTATAVGNTVNYTGITQAVKGTTYYNLTLAGGSGTKTLGGATIVNGALTINTGVTLATANLALTFGGDFHNNGIFTAGSSAITITTISDPQSIDGFTTTGLVSMTKTGGTATFQGNVNGAGLTINGTGGTLDLGVGLTHTFTGAWTRTNGTLLGNSSTLRIAGSISGTGGTFTAGSGTVEWNFAGAQTVAGVTYNNLTLSGSGTKTLGGATTINGVLTINTGVTLAGSTFVLTISGSVVNTGTFTAGTGTVYNGGPQTVLPSTYTDLTLSGSGTKTLPASLTSILGNFTVSGTAIATTTANLTVGVNFVVGTGATFAIGTDFTFGVTGTSSITGTFTLAGTGTKTFTTDVTINLGGVWNETGIAAINFSGNLTDNGTFTANTGVHSFSTAGNVISGTFEVAIPNLAINGTTTNSGTLTVSTALSGTSTLTNGATGILNIGGTSIMTGLTATAAGNIVNYTGTGQTIRVNTYYHLNLNGGAETSFAVTTINGNFTVSGTASATTAATLAVAGNLTLSGSAAVTTGANLTVSGNLVVGTGTTLTTGATFTLGVTLTSSITGNLTLAGTGAKTFTGSVTVNPGGVWNETGIAAVSYAANLTNSGTFTTSTGTHTFTGAAIQTITGATFGSLVINKSGGSANLGSDVTATNFTLTLGTFDATTFLLTATTPTLTAGVLRVGAATWATNYSFTPTPAVAFTIEYYNNNPTINGAITYKNLQFSGTGTAGTSSDLSVQEDLTATGGGTFDFTPFNVILSGATNSNFPIAGFTTTGTVSMTKTNGTATFQGVVNGGGLTLNGTGGTLNLGAGFKHTFTGNWTRTAGSLQGANDTLIIGGSASGTVATFNAGTGAVIYNAAGDQTLAGVTYNNLIISGGGTKTLGAATTVGGNLTLTGGTLAASSTLVFAASSTIFRSGGSLSAVPTFGTSINVSYLENATPITTGPEIPVSATVLNNLTINTSQGVILNSPATLKGIFALTNGVLTTTATNLLTCTSTATVGIGDVPTYVEGPMAYVYTAAGLKSAKNYPTGKDGIWRPVRLTLNQTTATSSTYIVEVISVAPPVNTLPVGLDGVSKVRYYNISEKAGGSAFTGGFLQILWGPDDWATDNTHIKIAQGPAAGGGTWVNIGGIGTGNQVSGNVTSTVGFTSLANTAFTLADSTGGANGLPVELTSFTSIANGRNVNLNWETKTEINSNKFVIERSIADANVANLKWESVTSVKTAFNSNTPRQYSYIDKNLQSGKYQYRLKMMDNDGSFEYSKVIETEIALPKDFDLSQNYPNPFNPTTKINYNLPNDSKVILEVYNLIGERVAQIVNEQQAAGYYVVNFGSSSFKNVASGIYIYKLTAVDNAGKNFSSIKKMMLLK